MKAFIWNKRVALFMASRKRMVGKRIHVTFRKLTGFGGSHKIHSTIFMGRRDVKKMVQSHLKTWYKHERY